jgi:c-di-GMP-binding flagellar brake protein YcgR
MAKQERKNVRIQSEQFISYKLYDKKGKVCDEGMGVARDVSKTGIALENRRTMEIGARIELTIALREDVIHTEGTIRNVKELAENSYLTGIEFNKISKEEIEQLAKEFPSIKG